MFGTCVLPGVCLARSTTFAPQGDRMELGRLQTGATISFVRAAGGEWGIEIAGATAPRLSQPQPVKLEVFRTEEDLGSAASVLPPQVRQKTIVKQVTPGGPIMGTIPAYVVLMGDLVIR